MESRQWKSSIAAFVLAVLSLLYIFAPPGLFIAILIVVPLVTISIVALSTDTFHEKN